MLNKKMFFRPDEAFLRGIKNNEMFYIAKDTGNGGKIVSSLKNIDGFLIWYDGQTVQNLYENIIDEWVEYYDIDGKPSENEYYKNDTKTIFDGLLRHLKNRISLINYANTVQDDVFVLEAKDLNVKNHITLVIYAIVLFSTIIKRCVI